MLSGLGVCIELFDCFQLVVALAVAAVVAEPEAEAEASADAWYGYYGYPGYYGYGHRYYGYRHGYYGYPYYGYAHHLGKREADPALVRAGKLQSTRKAMVREPLYEVNLGTFTIAYHRLNMQLPS